MIVRRSYKFANCNMKYIPDQLQQLQLLISIKTCSSCLITSCTTLLIFLLLLLLLLIFSNLSSDHHDQQQQLISFSNYLTPTIFSLNHHDQQGADIDDDLVAAPAEINIINSSTEQHVHDDDDDDDDIDQRRKRIKNIDLSKGEWVFPAAAAAAADDDRIKYYSSSSSSTTASDSRRRWCRFIYDRQNCIKYGRPDLDFMKWRWKPKDMDNDELLPEFDPLRFFELMRNKGLAFVGDSIATNHLDSLLCLLAPVEEAIVFKDEGLYYYPTYKFTIQAFWSPFLVEATYQATTSNPLYSLFLDRANEQWSSKIDMYDYVILSSCHWFHRPLYYYVNSAVIGCYYCNDSKIRDLGIEYGYRRAVRTAFKTMNNSKRFNGTVILRTISPSHFENGKWYNGGTCNRTSPFIKSSRSSSSSSSSEVGGGALDWISLRQYKIQIEEFNKAKREAAAEATGKKKDHKGGIKYRLMDITEAMQMRPDGHPDIYGHWPNEEVFYVHDCVHWCIPGPIDTWSQILLEMLMIDHQY